MTDVNLIESELASYILLATQDITSFLEIS